ncbi:MAG: hypothetical protein JXA78_03095 [Anaerolineales bacterium]|nr:hypothetical protein [Anaerolineales bacterium]
MDIYECFLQHVANDPLFAQVVEHPERARFLELRLQVNNPQCLDEAQELLIRCGAISYCIDQLLRRKQLACQALRTIPLYERDGLQSLLAEMIEPIHELFSCLGLGPAALALPG